MREYETIEYELDDGAGIIRLNRPEKMNAINDQMKQDLRDCFTEAEGDDDVRAVVLTGNGDAFSAGYDFSETRDEEYASRDGSVEYLQFSIPRFIFNLSTPVIAAVNGYALAGATNISVACDITIAGADAQFGYPEVHNGSLTARLILPYIGCPIKSAKELYFTGRIIDADEAAELNLVNRTVPMDDLMDEVRDVVDGIRLTPSSTVKLSKAQLNDAMLKQGFQERGKTDVYLKVMSDESASRQEFNRIRDEEGVKAAMEWMHETVKD